VVLGVAGAQLLAAPAALAQPPAPEQEEVEGEGAAKGPAPLIGDVIIFNDEIVEPVSLPISTCGSVLPLFSSAPSGCADTSRVSDDDA
jgi:hypothetical protein